MYDFLQLQTDKIKKQKNKIMVTNKIIIIINYINDRNDYLRFEEYFLKKRERYEFKKYKNKIIKMTVTSTK